MARVFSPALVTAYSADLVNGFPWQFCVSCVWIFISIYIGCLVFVCHAAVLYGALFMSCHHSVDTIIMIMECGP